MICSRAGLGALRAGSAPNDLRAADQEITAVPPLADDMVLHATDHSASSQILGDLVVNLAPPDQLRPPRPTQRSEVGRGLG